jgi:uncharacterized membrane protein YvlD (DUF360 family)
MNGGAARSRLDRAAVVLGVAAAASPLLGIAGRPPLKLITFGLGAVIVALLLAVTGGLLSKRALVVLAGAGFAAAAVLLVVQLSLGNSNTLGGDGSTVGIFLAFAVGLLPVGLAKEVPTNESSNRQPKGVSDGSQQPA